MLLTRFWLMIVAVLVASFGFLACQKEKQEMVPAGGVAVDEVAKVEVPVGPVAFCGQKIDSNETLVQCYNTQVTDLSPLLRLKNLERLYLKDIPLSDLSPLEKMVGLKSLDLKLSGVTDLSPLAALKELDELHLTGEGIRDLSVLLNLKKLRVLFLGKTGVKEFAVLGGMKQIKGMYVLDNAMPKVQLDALKKTLPECTFY